MTCKQLLALASKECPPLNLLLHWFSPANESTINIINSCKIILWKSLLVGGFNPSEKYWSNWESSLNRGENKKCLKPPPSLGLPVSCQFCLLQPWGFTPPKKPPRRTRRVSHGPTLASEPSEASWEKQKQQTPNQPGLQRWLIIQSWFWLRCKVWSIIHLKLYLYN